MIQEPYIIKHPETGEHINIASFLEFLENIEFSIIGNKVSDDAIRFFSTDMMIENVDNPDKHREFRDMLCFLYKVRDMITGITVCQKSKK
jgi:hypothetical protein